MTEEERTEFFELDAQIEKGPVTFEEWARWYELYVKFKEMVKEDHYP